MIELFAFLSEMLIYRLNRVTSGNLLSFLKLLNGPDWKPLGKDPDKLTPEEIAAEAPRTILQLRKLDRAVSSTDFEALTLEADARVARVKCLPRLRFREESGSREGRPRDRHHSPEGEPEPDLRGLSPPSRII